MTLEVRLEIELQELRRVVPVHFLLFIRQVQGRGADWRLREDVQEALVDVVTELKVLFSESRLH